MTADFPHYFDEARHLRKLPFAQTSQSENTASSGPIVLAYSATKISRRWAWPTFERERHAVGAHGV